MKLGERLAALDRAQQSTPFKVIATVLLALLTVGIITAYAVRVHAPVDPAAAVQAPVQADRPEGASRTAPAPMAARRAVEDVLAARTDVSGFAMVTLAVGGVAIGAVWLGLGLTYLAIVVVGSLVVVPLMLFNSTRGFGAAGFGLIVLVMSFTVLLQALRLLFSAPGPAFAVARNVLAEAVRMKVSLVFIVMVMILLAALPGVLDTTQPLRYRVQTFLSFGMGLSFWVIAILTILFSAATLSFEQREKVIWQTMTKPVSPWSYILGKWLGVVGLNAVLLIVCAAGVFTFVEYLRAQPAMGETTAFVSSDRRGGVSPDRLALERQILAARVVLSIDLPLNRSDPNFQQEVTRFIENERLATPEFATDVSQRREVEDSLYRSYVDSFRAVAPGRAARFTFSGLNRARDRDLPLVFRHRINVGGNRPDVFYTVSYGFGPLPPFPERAALGVYHSVQLTPAIILGDGTLIRVTDPEFERAQAFVESGELPGQIVRTQDLIEPDGTLFLEVLNGQLGFDRNSQQFMVYGNEETIVFPPDGLEISYAVGGFRGNYFRAIALMWTKLAFLAMLTIMASTFLSFPVACLVSFGSFLAAEGSNYLLQSVEVFGWTDDAGQLEVFKWAAAMITSGVGHLFSVYGSLDPVGSIVNGHLITWGSALQGLIVLLLVSGVMYAIASWIFSKRELAMYSGK